jgi:hypothetical protein
MLQIFLSKLWYLQPWSWQRNTTRSASKNQTHLTKINLWYFPQKLSCYQVSTTIKNSDNIYIWLPWDSSKFLFYTIIFTIKILVHNNISHRQRINKYASVSTVIKIKDNFVLLVLSQFIDLFHYFIKYLFNLKFTEIK